MIDRLNAVLTERYRVERELGAGGMAVVFLAEDLRHSRRVALKVVRPELSAVLGAERFLNEIRVTANLQHPHILPLYDSGSADGLLFYVMPFVAGESLRDRLNREKQLPIEEAVRLAQQAAQALDYAHRNGVVHRDIKPENILLHDGQALVADFGIALAVRAAGGNRLTETGLSLGTPQYMSPEQATADRELDARSDIYSLGCVTYEMIAGEPPHTGVTSQAVIARLMTEVPRRLSAARASVPAQVEAAVHKALEKLPADRWGSAAEFGASLTGKTGETVLSLGAPRKRAPPWRSIAAVALVGWIVTVVGVLFRGLATVAPETASVVVHSVLPLPDSAPVVVTGGLSAPVEFAGNRTIVYLGGLGSERRLYRRDLASLAVEPIPHTEGTQIFFVSPDGQAIAFQGSCAPTCSIKRVALDGTGLVTLATDLPETDTGEWTADGRLLLTGRDGLEFNVLPAAGGAAREIPRGLPISLQHPRLIPGTQWALVNVLPAAPVGRVPGFFLGIGAISLQTGAVVAITKRGPISVDSTTSDDWIFGLSPRLLPSGQLLYAKSDGAIMAVGFDRDALAIRGDPVSVLTGPYLRSQYGTPYVAVSAGGTLVYAPGPNALVGGFGWVDREGRIDSVPIAPGWTGSAQVSPDGGSILASVIPPDGPLGLVIYDLRQGTTKRLPGSAAIFQGVWTPDGLSIVYGSYSGHVVRRSATNMGIADSFPFGGAVTDVAPGGQLLAIDRFGFLDRPGIWLVPWGKPAGAVPIDTAATASLGQFSPDGEWLVYSSAEAGFYGLYTRPVDRSAPSRKVAEAASAGTWTRDGRGILYQSTLNQSTNVILELPVTGAGHARAFGPPRQVARLPRYRHFFNINIDPTADARFLIPIGPERKPIPSLHLVTGWLEEVKRRLPPAN